MVRPLRLDLLTTVEPVLVKQPLLRGSILKIGHANIVGSGGGIGRVSLAFDFFVKLTRIG